MKMCFARLKTAAAISAVLAATSTSVLAVNHSDDGLGEVGLVPYYTVRGNIDTNLSVVNTSQDYVVAFKIRFREGANSRDARDFNVYLSPNDVWTATVSLGDDGVPYVITGDTTCVAPWSDSGVQRFDFTSIDYTGGTAAGADGYVTDPVIARTQEGYFEVIEMGVADPDASQLAAWAVHGPGQNCAALSQVFNDANPQSISVTGSGLNCQVDVQPPVALGSAQAGVEAFRAEFCEPLNVLKVAANLITVDQGVAASLPVTTLANFVNPNPDGGENPAAPNARDISDVPAAPTPNMASAIPASSMQINKGVMVEDDFVDGSADAVSSLLVATEVLNEYALGGDSNADTAWVVTFPTKNFYVDGFLLPPFQNQFGSNGSPVTFALNYYDREENQKEEFDPGEVLPSPRPIVNDPTPDSINFEVNTLSFVEGSNLMDSEYNKYIELDPAFTSGWIRMRLGVSGSIIGLGGTIYNGLPTIGFALKVLENGVADTENARLNYGIVTPHAYARDIVMP